MQQLEVNGVMYHVVSLLGKGKGGYSYLAERRGKRFVVKQIHHEPCDYYQFGDKLAAELRDYETLQKLGIPMPRLLDVDKNNERLVKEYIDGNTIFDLVKADQSVAAYLPQVKAMCHLLYNAGLNIDYFPTNFVPSNGTLYYIDYECNPYSEEWNFENWGIQYWSKTPEFLTHLHK